MNIQNYIAKRFQHAGSGLSLDTEALSKYSDIIDLSIGDTDFTTDEAIIEKAYLDAKAGAHPLRRPEGRPGADCRCLQGMAGGLFAGAYPRPCARHRVELPRHGTTMLAILNPGDE